MHKNAGPNELDSKRKDVPGWQAFLAAMGSVLSAGGITALPGEQDAGSDVGAVTTEARFENGQWRLYGDKWFCPNPDADLAMALARRQGGLSGTKGLSLFLLPRSPRRRVAQFLPYRSSQAETLHALDGKRRPIAMRLHYWNPSADFQTGSPIKLRETRIGHRLRQPSRSYIVGASSSSDALKGNCG